MDQLAERPDIRATAQDQGQHNHIDEQCVEPQPVKGRRVPEFDDAGCGGTVFDECEKGGENRYKIWLHC